MKDTIIFRNRIEVKIISIAIGIIWGILYGIILYGDLSSHSPHFWHNQICLLIMLLIFSIPVLIIRRFKIIFDFKNQLITHIPYFRPKKVYSIDELEVSIQRGKTSFLTWDFVFLQNSKKLFSIHDLDFAYQTRESTDCLKMLLQGDAKFIFNLERAVKQEGFNFIPYDYSLAEHFGSVRAEDRPNWITIKYQKSTQLYTLQVWTFEIDQHKGPKEHILDESTASADTLTRSVLELAHQYL